MDCPRCSTRNGSDARFCERCGGVLARRCSSCGRELGEDARFCSGCGLAIGAGPGSAAAEPAHVEEEAGERRQLTVLFCDLVRSTEIAARLDPEDWAEALAAFQKAADAVVARYGGHVAQHLGDGLLAYFGWPQAMDDAAERAVRAGLELAAAASGVVAGGRTLAVRVGVHTGTVVVSPLGDGTSAETLALGQVPHVAARVQSAAEAGCVLVTAETQRLTAGLFVIEERGSECLPGLPEPLALYRVVRASGVRGRLHAAAASQRLTTFVGREQERDLLRERFELALEGEGEVVLVTGEPGIGKSRLVQQLKEDLGGAAHTWVEAAGSPYLQHTPFAPIADLLLQGFRFAVDLPMDDRVATVERALEAMGMAPSRALPSLAPLLGLTLPERYPPFSIGPEEQRRRLMATMVEWTLEAARVQPAVIVLEDLHWMDASTLELVSLLVDQVATARILLVLTARPEFRAPWPQRAHHAQLSLARLSRRHTRELIAAVAARALAKSELVEALVARTDGVPLFVEELARAVVESGEGAAPRDIPATLQDTLMARLDRLGDAKAVAQMGAVLGREFRFAELLAVSERSPAELGPALARLCDAELLYARGLGPEASYTFKHALVQQAAYESLLRSRRRELHGRAAAVLSRAPGTPPALLAHHFECAGEAASAVSAWQAAAEHARRSAASFEVAEHFRRALAALATLPESRERDRQELALQYPFSSYLVIAQGTESPELHAARARARELAERVGDATMSVNVLSSFWAQGVVRGEYRTALAISEQMLELAERDGALGPRLKAHANKGMCHYWVGELAASREDGERVLALWDPEALRDDPLDRRILALSYLAGSAAVMGRVAETRRREKEMLAAARDRGVVTDLALAECQALLLAIYRREPVGMVEKGKELVGLCTEHKLELFRATSEIYLGWALAQLGEGPQGVALVREGHRRQLATGNLGGRSLGLFVLAEAEVAAGLGNEARATVEDAIAAIGDALLWRPDLLRLRGDLLAEASGDADDAEASYREAVELSRATGALLFELRAAVGLARLLERHGQRAEARGLLAPVCARFAEADGCRDGREARALVDALG